MTRIVTPFSRTRQSGGTGLWPSQEWRLTPEVCRRRHSRLVYRAFDWPSFAMTTLWSAEAYRGYQSIGGSNPSGPTPFTPEAQRRRARGQFCVGCGFEPERSFAPTVVQIPPAPLPSSYSPNRHSE
ncbi:hypothetical protein HSR6_0944 [Halodesulfurarchaeum formicicum]|uniref:Uncharacterized protein n=1 Tax=Halodesulfurarchaeum formicicum TaxID=1873524 RepID=A0A1J1ABZ1_9EURY|nr:hypothetical protein HSR6_0944 [Halodesulfurarchaeum formicicum]